MRAHIMRVVDVSELKGTILKVQIAVQFSPPSKTPFTTFWSSDVFAKCFISAPVHAVDTWHYTHKKYTAQRL